MSPPRWLWCFVAAMAVAVVQTVVVDELSIAGVHPELLWVLPVAAGLAAGAVPGMAMGLVAGAVWDLFVPGPFGLSALVAVLVGYAAGVLGEEGVGDLGGAAYVVAPLVAAAGGLCAPCCYALFGAIGGHHDYLSVHLVVVALLDAAVAAAAVRPVMRLVGRRLAGDPQRAGSLEPVRGSV